MRKYHHHNLVCSIKPTTFQTGNKYYKMIGDHEIMVHAQYLHKVSHVMLPHLSAS